MRKQIFKMLVSTVLSMAVAAVMIPFSTLQMIATDQSGRNSSYTVTVR